MAGYDATIDMLPPVGMLDLRGDANVRQVCEATLGLRLPESANSLVVGSDNRIVYCISPDHWILQIDDGQQGDVFDSLEKAATKLSHSFVDVSDMYVRIRLSGSEARHVLAQGISIDIHPRVFPAGTTARTSFAKTIAQLHCVDDSPTFIMTVYRSYRQYAIDWLRAAIGPA